MITANKIKDYQTDSPNFHLYRFGLLLWGTRSIIYTEDNMEVTLRVEEDQPHEIVMLHIPEVDTLIEVSGLWFSGIQLFLNKVTWNNIKPVVGDMKVTIGNKDNSLSFIKNFYYRSKKVAEKSWNSLVKTNLKDIRIIKSDDNSVLIVRKIEEAVLNDPELYVDNVRYLKKIQGLYPDHNSRVEKWEMTWR